MFEWTPDMIRFLEDAAGQTGYYRLLQAQLAAMLPPDAHVCDMGCGLGHLAELLAECFPRVTAIDRSAAAIDAFRSRLPQPPSQLEILCADAFSLPAEFRCAAMVFCYFGSLPDILTLARRHCTGEVVIIRRNELRHRFDLGGSLRQSPTLAQTLERLRGLGICTEVTTHEIEFGQPLRSQADAVRFFSLYRRDPGAEIVFSQLAPLLEQTGDPVFPYYHRQQKRIAIVRFPAAQIPPL